MTYASHSPEGGPREIFAAEVDAFFAEMPEVVAVGQNLEAFALDVTTTSGSHKVFLDNAFAETRELSPEDRLARLHFMFDGMAEPSEETTWAEARDVGDDTRSGAVAQALPAFPRHDAGRRSSPGDDAREPLRP